jgi:hypothetical protein
VLDIARAQRENLLFNIYRMARNSIERGSKDTWTTTPTEIDEVKRRVAADRASRAAWSRWRWRRCVGDPILRSAVVPTSSSQRNPRAPTSAIRAATSCRATSRIPDGDEVHQRAAARRRDVHRATRAVHGQRQAVSRRFVRREDRPSRSVPHVLDMFEPQDHPNDFAYPGGPPKRPYDNAGYTLAFQMGVQFDRILDAFNGPFEMIRVASSPRRCRKWSPVRRIRRATSSATR